MAWGLKELSGARKSERAERSGVRERIRVLVIGIKKEESSCVSDSFIERGVVRSRERVECISNDFHSPLINLSDKFLLPCRRGSLWF